MDTFMIFWIILVTIATVTFLNYPAPALSPRLKSWYKKGSFMQYKDFKIFYIVEDGMANDDSTVLCIHGFPTSSHDWKKVLDDLKEQYSRVIMADMLGFGFSDKPWNYDFLITEQADILSVILESQSVQEVHLLSHDYGDTVALEMLHRHNNNEGNIKILSLCLLNGGIFPETNFPLLLQRMLLVPVLGDFMSHISSKFTYTRGLGHTFGPATYPTDEDFQDFYAVTRFNDGHKVMSRLIHYITQRGINKDRWVGALQKTRVPVHMIYGPSDPVNPPVFIEHYKKTVPNPSIDVLDDSIGHYPQWEDPSGVMRSYRKFIEKVTRSQAANQKAANKTD